MMDRRNHMGKTPYDLCITDGARELLEDFGYAYVVVSANPTAAAGVRDHQLESDMDHLSMEEREEGQQRRPSAQRRNRCE